MRIHSYDPASCRILRESFEAHGLIYGAGPGYSSLIAPASVRMSHLEVIELARDVDVLASLYRTTNSLYLASLRGSAPPWIKGSVEAGLTQGQCSAHRLVAEAGLEPMMMRVDYVEVSARFRQIAEVQWKSGGPGLFIGHAEAYRQVYPLEPGTTHFGDLTRAYLDTLVGACQGRPGLAVNEARVEWLNGEQHLISAAHSRGLAYLPLDRARLSEQLSLSNDGIVVSDGGQNRVVAVLRGRGFTDVLADSIVKRLAIDSLEGRIWIETPLNYVYRQKWCMSLPFMTQFRDSFDNRLRAILIPTALVVGETIDLSAVGAAFAENLREQIVNVTTLEGLCQLPASVRARLVIKCGSGVGKLQSGGHGVFRLGGSRAAAAKTVYLVRNRAAKLREPWIIQPYADHKYEIPLTLPEEGINVQHVMAHARVMVFGGRHARTNWHVQGAIGNFGSHWKVSGARARSGGDGQLLGSAFTEVRVEDENRRMPY